MRNMLLSIIDYHSVQIVQKFRDGTLKLDKEVLKRVLKNSWDQPTAILSVCGDKRKGKSFLINLLLHYLTRVSIIFCFMKPCLKRHNRFYHSSPISSVNCKI